MKPCPICAMARKLDKGAKWGKPVLGQSKSAEWLTVYTVSCSKCGLGDRELCVNKKDARERWERFAAIVAESLRTAGTWCGPLVKAVGR